ncbi:hypothetical protein EVAR_22712_1 [Eumeta japonica]|uniref:Uncharacterized protein n=1 Tax=Eumeta variegata TaxID=151549 RepID=A0A4C1USX9_EUMVA|nr:hypothetical protein EVAR_22712_1 [Eumeta japonica]
MVKFVHTRTREPPTGDGIVVVKSRIDDGDALIGNDVGAIPSPIPGLSICLPSMHYDAPDEELQQLIVKIINGLSKVHMYAKFQIDIICHLRGRARVDDPLAASD